MLFARKRPSRCPRMLIQTCFYIVCARVNTATWSSLALSARAMCKHFQKVILGFYQELRTYQIGSQRACCKTPLQNLRTPHQSWNSLQNQSWTLILQSQTSSDHGIQTRILQHLLDHQHHPGVFAWCQESSPQPGGLQFVQGGRSIALVQAPCSEDALDDGSLVTVYNYLTQSSWATWTW